MPTKLSLGFSPCPNDTFIFDALVNRKIDTGEFEFEVILEDVQTLNRWALEKKLDISKVSYGVWPLLQNNYSLLDAGGALGKGVGPLLISKNNILLKDIDKLTIAIPGEQTTAHLLFSLAFPNAKRKKFMVFNRIESAVLEGEVDCGVIIHENRFTYMQKGLIKQMDLGEYWEQKTKTPIPLGGIVMRKEFTSAEKNEVDRLIRDSVAFAEAYYPDLSDYVIRHSQEMQESVMRQHIDLYVNQFSLSLGEEGRMAVETLLHVYEKMNQK
ncbi:MAG TPA: 1,4-dihydroxy-6-naphthoate synthase [Puia sp.]|nr:1,4-dihydroxy-6-naphthoate synthase [Puia sp.]